MKIKSTLLITLAAVLLPATYIQAKPGGGPGGQGQGPQDGQHQRPSPGQGLKRMDANQDGEISRAEADAAAKARVDKLFEHLDADDSGVITKEELEAARERGKEKRGERRERKQDAE